MGLRDIPIKNEYRSLIDDVIKDFYVPAVGERRFVSTSGGFFFIFCTDNDSEGN